MEPRMVMSDGQLVSWDLQKRFHAAIPGGGHTYAKGDDQFPEVPPIYIVAGKGAHVWDVEGKEYIEYGMGLRSVTLGHAFEPIVEAATRQMRLGINFNRPSPIEVECAEKFLELVSAAQMVKFAKNGSDVVDAALRLARAHTGRDLVAVCGDQPFFSFSDWFIGSTPLHSGVPQAVKELTIKFRYNNLDSIEELFRTFPRRVAAVILEVEKEVPPGDGFLKALRDLCDREGALLIFDEMITGFRWHNGGAQAYYGVTPDLSTFGKALGNGFSIAALCGRKEIMERGGRGEPGKRRVFLLSTTHGAEAHNLAAALEVMNTYQREPVVETLWNQGRKLKVGIDAAIDSLDLRPNFQICGKPCCLVYRTADITGASSQGFRTLFLQETLKRGLLAPSLIVSYSHSDEDIQRTIEAVSGALGVYRRALDEGLEKFLVGRPVKPVFREFD